jgi:5-methylcytosine-specific restriction endonuclease McrA
MYQILMISSLCIVFWICDGMIDRTKRWRVKRNILSNPILRYEYYKKGYSLRKIKRLKHLPHTSYLRTPHWDLVRSAAFKRDRGCCADCGVSIKDEPLEVHHITYIRKGRENLEDLMTLCRQCHQEHHFISTSFE